MDLRDHAKGVSARTDCVVLCGAVNGRQSGSVLFALLFAFDCIEILARANDLQR